MTQAISKMRLARLAIVIVTSLALVPVADAVDRGGGGGGARAGGGGGGARASGGGGGARAGGGGGGANKQRAKVNNSKRDVRTNNVRSTSVNNVNVDRNVNVNRNVNVDVDRHGGCCGWDNDYHPVATAAAVTAAATVTAAVVGSIVNAPPPGCTPVNYGGVIYQQCGATWYMPQGPQFVVVNPPY